MFFYRIISTILFLVILPIYYLVRVFQGKFLYGWNFKLGFFKKRKFDGKVIMFHGVSVGEIIALENLIKTTKQVFPQCSIVITTGTKTGQEIARKKFDKIADFITYFPFDISPSVNRFLSNINPSVVLIAETEIWPIFAYSCKNRGIPLYVINARLSDSTYSLYKLVKRFFSHVLANYKKILTQSQEDAEKFLSIGAPKENVRVMNNLKFDVKRVDAEIDMGQDGYRVIVAGSTHKGENQIVLETFKNLKKDYDDIKLLIAPRHTTRVSEIKDIAKSLKISYGLRSKNDSFKDYDIIILDTIGELSRMYSICHVAFIGGSFNKTGGHNPLEATVYSKPTITGPSIHNFKDIYSILSKSNAGKIVKTPQELEERMRQLLSDKDLYNKVCEDCKTIFEAQQGALDVVIEELKTIL